MIIPCRKCGKKLKIKKSLAGKRVKCPSCGSTFIVPKLENDSPFMKKDVQSAGKEAKQEEKQEEKKEERKASETSVTSSTETSGMIITESDFEENYEVIDEIARGGMGIVYKARQKSLNRIVAVKVMLAGEDASEMDIKRFLREAEACSNLKHPNIIDIFDIGKYKDNFYFAMEFIDGEMFDVYMKRADVDIEDKLEKYMQVVDAISYAHERGIIHRDLKPSNIMLTKEGMPKVMDFGLAKKLKEAEGEESLSLKTQAGAVIGTPHYMSPEQANGDTELIDHRTDIFALGVIMYEMVTGVRPFRGNNMNEIMFSIFTAEPERPVHLAKKLDWELEAIILKAMEKEIPRRYASAADMCDDIERFLSGRTILARKISKWYLLRKRIRKNKIQFSLGALLLIVLITAGSYFTWDYLQKKRERELEIQRRKEEIQKYESLAKTNTADVEKFLQNSGPKKEYPELKKKIEAVKADLVRLSKLDEDNIAIKEVRLKIDEINKNIDTKKNEASALEKCATGDDLLQRAEEDLKTDDKVRRLDGMKKILDALQAYNEAFLIKPDLKQAKEGRFSATMRLAKAAREDRGYNLAILMYHQARGIMPGNKEVTKLYKETEEEAANLKFYQQQVARGKQYLTERKWEEAESCFKLAREKIKDNPEIPVMLRKAEFGRKYDNARSIASEGRYIEGIKRLEALYQDAPEDRKKEVEREISDVRKTGTDTYFKKARSLFTSNKYKEAEKALKNVLTLTPGNKEAETFLRTIQEISQTPEKLIYIKEGEFRKGSAEAEANNPLKGIRTGSYYIGEYEVTNNEYYAFVKDGGYDNKTYWDEEGWSRIDTYVCSDGKIKGPSIWVEGKPPVGKDDVPVTGISVYEAKAFAAWKAEKTGRAYRLCSEWEWEKAASWDSSTNTKLTYPWGDKWSGKKGSFGTEPVKAGTYKSDKSPHGCYDMGGNVSEWTWSPDNNQGVLRGGTCGQPEDLAKIYARTFNRNVPQDGHMRSPFIGFRLACDIK